MRTSFLSCLALLCLPLGARAADAYAFQAQTPVTNKISVPVNASPQTRANAEKLADLLHRITSVRFVIGAGDGTTGIALGRADDFPALQTGVQFDAKSPSRREEYLIRTHTKGIWLLGATEIAAQNAMWDLLHRLGYRQYFPGEAWEVIPTLKDARIEADSVERPSYAIRRIWYGYGISDYATLPYADWCAKNRCTVTMELNLSHAYESIVKALEPEFKANPSYWPLIDGERRWLPDFKPDLGNPKVRSMIVDHVVRQLHFKPLADSVGLDPSDGGGWSESPESAALGSVSDQVATLGNEAAIRLQKEFPGKVVSYYAYNFHSPPPNIRIEPNVVVSVATAFIKGGLTIDELLSGWAKQGATLGIREYYSVNTWDRDQPGHARGGNLDYLQRTVPHFHAMGARYMSSEASDNWGPNGLGYWFATRMMWDIREAQQRDALVEDFLTRAFGPAKEPMRAFYRQLDGSTPKLVVNDQLGRMYRSLDQAFGMTSDPAIQKRINDLTLYAHYCTLYQVYARAQGAERQQAFEALIRHAWRMRTTMLVHTRALYLDLANRDKSVQLPQNARWQVPEGINPWKSSRAFEQEELRNMRQEGIARHPLVELAFKPVSYSSELLPLPSGFAPQGPAWPRLQARHAGSGTQAFLTYVHKSPSSIQLQLTGGLIKHYRDRGNVKVDVFKITAGKDGQPTETLVATDRSVPPDGTPRPVTIPFKQPGLYRVVVNDGRDRTEVQWPEEIPLSIRSTVDDPINTTYGSWAGYFYVPKGTRVIGFYGGEHGEILDPEGRVVFWLNGREKNYYSVDVPANLSGQFWRVRYVKGPLHLLTVPPYFARHPQELLLPRSVLLQDGKR